MKKKRWIKLVILLNVIGTLLLSGCHEQSYDMEDVPNMDYTITKESTNQTYDKDLKGRSL